MDKQALKNAVMSSYGLSVLLHLGIVLFLVLSVRLTSHTPSVELPVEATPQIVKATFIDPAVTQAQYDREQAQKQAAERARQERFRQERAAAKKKRQEQARKAAEAKQKREAEAKVRQQKELERKAQAALERKRAAEAAERKRREAAQKEQARKAEEQRKLEEALAAEQAVIAEQQRQRVLTEKQRYSALIKATIQRNLIVNDAFRGKKCLLNIRLGIGGVVLKVDQLSGDEALCRAAIAAVYKPSNLPVSRDPAVFAELKNINLTVEQ